MNHPNQNREATAAPSTPSAPRDRPTKQQRRRTIATIYFIHVVAIITGFVPHSRVAATIVEAPKHLLTEEQQKDEELAAFVSSEHTKNIHQYNSQHVQTPDELAAFVSDHVPNKNIHQQTTAQSSQQPQQQQRRWGTKAGTGSQVTSPLAPTRASATETVTSTTFEGVAATASSNASLVQEGGVGSGGGLGSNANSLPFVPPKVVATASPHAATATATATSTSAVLHAPPEGFVVTARVYTDPEDKLSHFDSIPTNIVLPFYECGAMGLSTNSLPLSHASFRHALAGSQVWSGNFFLEEKEQQQQPKPRRGKSSSSSSTASSSSSRLNVMEEDERQAWHPHLAIALTDLEIVLNSGETKLFSRGDVILLEDTVLGGHKLRAVAATNPSGATGASTSNSHLPQDMTVLMLTLPHYYHKLGKDHHSLQGFTTTLITPPCPVDDEKVEIKDSSKSDDGSKESSLENKIGNGDVVPRNFKPTTSFGIPQPRSPRRPRKKQIQQVVLSLLGLSVSTVMADFLGKVAPLWLAVGVGGTCFVVGCTYGIVTTGMQALEHLDMTWERQRLLSSMHTTTTTTTTTRTDTTGSSSSTTPSDRPELHPKSQEQPPNIDDNRGETLAQAIPGTATNRRRNEPQPPAAFL